MAAHPIVHVDIATNDPQASAKFYGDLFGWTSHRNEQFNYTMWMAQNGPGGGFSSIGDPVGVQTLRPLETVVFVGTDDMDATLEKVEQLGGRVTMPTMEIPGNGWLAIFEDPFGGRIGLYKGM